MDEHGKLRESSLRARMQFFEKYKFVRAICLTVCRILDLRDLRRICERKGWKTVRMSDFLGSRKSRNLPGSRISTGVLVDTIDANA